VLTCDFTNRTETNNAVAKVLAACGALDIMVYAAGANVTNRSMRSLSGADWDLVVGANLTGAFNLMHAVLPSMREKGHGLIIQLGSLAGKRANVVSGVAYSVAKFGQTALGTCVSREERGRGIRCTMIYAGEVDTPFLDSRASRPGGGENTRRQMILKPEDIADAVRFVAELPPRAHVAELLIKPAIDDFA
jgi:NADP-dependent 3-hydroxy acid dehydrogenase YdfG